MSDEMNVGVLDHVAIHTRKLEATVCFYEKILGLKCGPRAQFNFPGVWLYSRGQAVVHLVETTDNAERPMKRASALDHVALLGSGFEAARRHFAEQGVWFDARENTADGVNRIFLRDPNGILIELNYRSAGDAR